MSEHSSCRISIHLVLRAGEIEAWRMRRGRGVQADILKALREWNARYIQRPHFDSNQLHVKWTAGRSPDDNWLLTRAVGVRSTIIGSS